MWGGQLDVKPM